MQFRFERAIARAFYRRQRFIEDGDGAAWIAGPGLGLGQRNFQEPVEYEHVLRAQVFDAAAHVLDPSVGRSTLSRRPTLEKRPKRAVHGQLMLTGESGEFDRVLRGARMVGAHQFEHGRVHSSHRERADV